MFTLTLVEPEYDTSDSIWEFEMMTVLKIVLNIFQLATRLNSQKNNDTEFINVL